MPAERNSATTLRVTSPSPLRCSYRPLAQPSHVAATRSSWTSGGVRGMLASPNEEEHMLRSSGRRGHRWFHAIPVRATAVEVRGSALRGPTATSALAVGATALGALALGRLAIGRAVIKRLVIEDLEVRRLRVTDLEIANERRPALPSAGSPAEPPA